MKAIAKHDCYITESFSLDVISLNRRLIRKGQEIELPVYEDRTFAGNSIMAEALGGRSVVFNENGLLLSTYGCDFVYIDSPENSKKL